MPIIYMWVTVKAVLRKIYNTECLHHKRKDLNKLTSYFKKLEKKRVK